LGAYSFKNLTSKCSFLSRGYIPEMRRKVESWEIVAGHTIYNSFTISPQRLVQGTLHRELAYMTDAATNYVKKDLHSNVDLCNVANIYVRYRGTVGREFIFDLELNGSNGLMERRVALLLPHVKEKVTLFQLPSLETRINFIVPLDGLNRKKIAKFQRYYYTICVRKKENCRLVYVMYSGSIPDVNFMRTYLARFQRRHSAFIYEYVIGVGKFNKTAAYELGLSKLEDDELAFIASVELSVADHFLNRCRAFSRLGMQIYYPELFMYYNMPYVYTGKWHPRNYDYTRLHGHWGTNAVACIYKSDYIRVGGYSMFKQWELEPSLLQSPALGSLSVMQAPDPGVSHWYEATKCDSKLPPEQFSRCLSMRSDNLADRVSLASYMQSLEKKCGDNTDQQDT